MDILSTKRWATIGEKCDELHKAAMDQGNTFLEKPYCVEINFRNIKDDSLRAACNRLPTSFKLKKAQLELIDKVVPELVGEDPEVGRLVGVIGE